MIALRAIAFHATPCAPRRAVAAIGAMTSMSSGYATAHSSACIPPSDPPLARKTRSMPSAVRNARCARTMSDTVMTGKSVAYGRRVRGSTLFGPVEPRQLPMRFVQITKYRSVSNALVGPIIPSHQPRPSGLGWWDGMIGPTKAFDTDRYFVICTNLIGSCRGSTGPNSVDPRTGRPYATDFPVITVSDMVRAQRAFLTALGIERVFLASGGSLGGMQALEWAVAYPDDIDVIAPIAATARLGAQGVAWNAIARSAIMADPDWQEGRYYGS